MSKKLLLFVVLLVGCSTTKPTSKLQKRILKIKLNINSGKKVKRVISKKIGIIIDNDFDKDKSKNILNGLKKSAQKIKSQFKGKFFIVKSSRDKESIKRNLNALINKNKVTVIISWGDKKYLNEISRQWKDYKMPTFFISKDKFINNNIYTIAPNSDNYGENLSEALLRRNIKRIAILTPQKYKNSDFLNNIKKHFKKNNITIVYDEIYVGQDFYSMNKACEEIFVIDNIKRKEELISIFEEEKQKATAKGFSLNNKLVFLPAQINFDAIFIPDNFRMVKHFVKLFKFYKANGIKLIGTHEWRSESLISSNEPMLDGAIFVDFIGDYNLTPLSSDNSKLKLFIDAKDSFGQDYALMGFYTGLLSQIAGSIPMRARNTNHILKTLSLNDKFLGKRRAFNSNNFNWPTFLFEIKSNKLNIISK